MTDDAKTLTILLLRGHMASEYADMAVNMAIKAREKGYNVNMFLYEDGVWAQKKGQGPKLFPNIGDAMQEAADMGVDVRACVRCSEARGITEDEIIPGSEITSLYDFVNFTNESDKIVTFTG